MSMTCVFDEKKDCPVRKAMRGYIDTKNQLDRIIKPTGDTELLKMFMPIIDKMGEAMRSEFMLLHEYCAICRASVPCP